MQHTLQSKALILTLLDKVVIGDGGEHCFELLAEGLFEWLNV